VSQGQVITCDVCGRTKQETNHWFRIVEQRASPEAIVFALSGAALDDPRQPTEDICGQECAHIRLSQFLASLTA
jgi:hypothetical protein